MTNFKSPTLLVFLFAFLLFIGGCQKEETKTVINNDESVTESFKKIETSYLEGMEVVETDLTDSSSKNESDAPEWYKKTIKGISEIAPIQKKSTMSLIGQRVGVIKDYNKTCGIYDELEVHMDCENDGNANSSSGWTGATFNTRNTSFYMCLVPKDLFKASKYYQYAVLSLDYGIDYILDRYFDNEDNNTTNWINLNGVRITGNDISTKIGNGIIQNSNTELLFIVYDQNTVSGSESFPDLGINYGVFGYFSSLGSGLIKMDDEDDGNTNKLWYHGRYITPTNRNSSWLLDLQSIINIGSDGRNTTLYMTRVK